MSRIMEKFMEPGDTLGPNHVRDLMFGNYNDPDSEAKIYDEVLEENNCLSIFFNFS